MELRKRVPVEADIGDDDIEADVECSSFFLLKEELPAPGESQKRPALPRGA
jgi:hypothetical protein